MASSRSSRGRPPPARRGTGPRPAVLLQRLPLQAPGTRMPAVPRSSALARAEAWSCPVHRGSVLPRFTIRRRWRGCCRDRADFHQLEDRPGRGPDGLLLEPVGGHLVRGRLEDHQRGPAQAVGAELAGRHQEVGPGTRLGVELEVGHQVALGEPVDQPGRARRLLVGGIVPINRPPAIVEVVEGILLQRGLEPLVVTDHDRPGSDDRVTPAVAPLRADRGSRTGDWPGPTPGQPRPPGRPPSKRANVRLTSWQTPFA